MFKKCIFPEEHGQLVPGSPNRRDDNPYFDENSERQHIQVEGNVSTPALGQNMMRRLHRDPYEIYEPVKVLGTGSMVRCDCFMFQNISLKLFHTSTCLMFNSIAGLCKYG